MRIKLSDDTRKISSMFCSLKAERLFSRVHGSFKVCKFVKQKITELVKVLTDPSVVALGKDIEG